MNNKKEVVYLILILILNVACTNRNETKHEVIFSLEEVASNMDTLKFTSGIRSIFQDSRGKYWFGSVKEGVALYDGQAFTYFNIKDGLTDNQVHNIQEDKRGVIWFNTQHGVSSFDGIAIKNHTIEDIEKSKFHLPLFSGEAVLGQWIKSDDDIWFGAGIKNGVYRFDGQNLNYLAFPPHKDISIADHLFVVTDIAKGRHNMIWIATYAGVFGFDGSDFTIINDETLGFDREVAPLHIRSILEDSKGRLWVGNNGIGVLLKDGDSIINFSEKNNLIHPHSVHRGDKSMPGTLEHVFTIAEDSQGNMWFGDRDTGIWKYNGVTMTNYTIKDGLTDDFALSIFEDDKGVLWFGMADGSVYIFDSKIFKKFF